MKVYIRGSSGTDARYLTELSDFNDAPRLLSFLKEAGVYVDGQSFGTNDSWMTQVVIDEHDAYFEIIVGEAA